MKPLLIGLLGLGLTGCAVSPIPADIQERHAQAMRDAATLEPLMEPGDILFRLSSTPVAGNLVNFSRGVAKLSDSDFSHAVLVLRNDEAGVLLVDVTAHGIERRYLSDWLMDSSTNLVVKRLRPEYRDLLPEVMRELDAAVAADNLYDDKFVAEDDVYYCTELVDHIFRKVDHPLADRIRVDKLPRYNVVIAMCCIIAGIESSNEVVVAGNDEIGLFSSPMLDTVVDLRPHVMAARAERSDRSVASSTSVKRLPCLLCAASD